MSKSARPLGMVFLAGLCVSWPGAGCTVNFFDFGEPQDALRCGDGLVTAGEECDDGNVADGDGCSSVCLFETGNAIGAPCGDDASRCSSGMCQEESTAGFPQGMCTQDCSGTSCPVGSTCNASRCYAQCDAEEDCRAGYSCVTGSLTIGQFCVANCERDAQCLNGTCNPYTRFCEPDQGLRRNGEACTGPTDCEGGLCLMMSRFPGGYCASYCALGDGFCPAEGVCSDVSGGGLLGVCLDGCSSSSECRGAEGYGCGDDPGTSGGGRVCVGPEQGNQVVITTTSVPATAPTNLLYLAPIAASGGSGSYSWSFDAAGPNVNMGWLSIDPSGVVSGTPGPPEAGSVTFTVRVEDAVDSNNFATQTFNTVVVAESFTSTFDTSIGGWVLAGDWEWGTPSTVGPQSCAVGQCIATRMSQNYSDNQTLASNTATSPTIDLAGLSVATLEFASWMEAECNWDGGQVQVSTDGGSTFNVVTSVTPAYEGTGDGANTWCNGASWQQYSVDLSSVAGQTIQLRFAFLSDSGTNYAGWYVDELRLTGQ